MLAQNAVIAPCCKKNAYKARKTITKRRMTKKTITPHSGTATMPRKIVLLGRDAVQPAPEFRRDPLTKHGTSNSGGQYGNQGYDNRRNPEAAHVRVIRLAPRAEHGLKGNNLTGLTGGVGPFIGDGVSDHNVSLASLDRTAAPLASRLTWSPSSRDHLSAACPFPPSGWCNQAIAVVTSKASRRPTTENAEKQPQEQEPTECQDGQDDYGGRGRPQQSMSRFLVALTAPSTTYSVRQ